MDDFYYFFPGNDLRAEKKKKNSFISFVVPFCNQENAFSLEKFMISYEWGMSRALKICHHNKYVSMLSLSVVSL